MPFYTSLLKLHTSVYRNDIIGILFTKDLVFADLEVGLVLLLNPTFSLNQPPPPPCHCILCVFLPERVMSSPPIVLLVYIHVCTCKPPLSLPSPIPDYY